MNGEYLVHHGCAGHLGRFSTADARAFGRGEAVVVRSRRGLELGEVLCPCSPDGAVLPDPFIGDLLRPATATDIANAEERRDLGRRLFDTAVRRADDLGLALAVIDVEVLLDGQQALLHAVRFGACEEAPYLAGLGECHGLIVRLYDVAAESGTAEETSCGSCGEGGCGDGGCGECGDGCNSCGSGGAAELAVYFSQLREQMEQRHRVALL